MKRFVGWAAVAVACVAVAEPIRWMDGTWDDSGAPKGKLLSDNHHFYGPRVFTGMTYTYEVAPDEPADTKGVRLRGANNWIRGNSFVGRRGDKPITVVFDFKRPCSFNEVVLFSPFCTNAAGSVEFSFDNANWSGNFPFRTVAAHTRVRLVEPGKGRYLRLRFQADPKAQYVMDRSAEDKDGWLRERCMWAGPAKLGHTYLNEVYVWGEGEVSAAYPEDIKPIPAGNSLLFTNVAEGVVSILPMRLPHLDRKPSGKTPDAFALKLVRNETESRYFAIVNGKKTAETVALAAPELGEGVATELLIGGVSRKAPPKRILTDEELAIMATTNREGALTASADELDVLPFFFADSKPCENHLRKFVANPQQVAGFPSAVRLAPGEGCVVMLRLTSANAAPGVRCGAMKAGDAQLPVEVTVVDVTLPPQRNWLYAYEPFTQQFPFESASRMKRDVKRFAESGFNCTKLLPKPGTKEELFFKAVPEATVGYYPWVNRSLYPRLLKGEFPQFTAAERETLLRNARGVLARAAALGVKPYDVLVFLPDEPRLVNARSTMTLAKFLKENIPGIQLNCDPLMHEGAKGFLPDDEIIRALGDDYNTYVDCSSPIEFITASRPKLMKALWTKPRRINGQYNHPGTRMGRETAFTAFANGFNGHAYYCYFDDLERVDGWDTQTWDYNDYRYQAVYPLENDVALAPLYETLREATEDYRLLNALKAAGKEDVLKAVLARAASGAWDRTNVLYRHLNPNAEDILDLRETIIDALAPKVTVREEDRTFVTYPFGDPDPVPAVSQKRYPYFRYDGSTDSGVTQLWKTVVLENDRIRVTLMPSIGGKVWGAVDKLSGVDFVYSNGVVKFRDIAMRGPWVSGGIEFNFGILGHAPSSATPVDWFVRTNADGSASFFAASDEYVTRSRWQVEVRLRPGAEQFETHTVWHNASGLDQPYYHWMNAAFHLEKNARFLFPATRYAGHTGRTFPWPVDAKGRDLSVYAANAFGFNKSYHVLNGDGNGYGVWWPERGVGAVHRSRSWEKFGRKIWLWSLAREGAIWEDLLTDSDGQYTELQSGRYFIQPIPGNHLSPFKHPCFAPGSTESFSETWGVLRSPGDFEKNVASKTPVPRPDEMPTGFDWNSAAGFALRGWQYLLDHDLAPAEREFASALRLDSQCVRAMNGMASLELRRGRYAECHALCRRMMAIDASDEHANYHDGFAYFAEGDYVSARDRLGVAALGLRYRSAAHALIARSYLAEGNATEASYAADRALAFNADNLDALLARLIARRLAADSAWRAEADALLERFPLFHAVRFERDGEAFLGLVRNELPAETVREIAFWYRESGLAAECAKLMSLAATLGGPRLPPFRREESSDLRRAAEKGGWRAKYDAAVLLAGFHLDAEADRLLTSCGNEPDSAAFYLLRGSRRKGAAALADFTRAESCRDADWRVGNALAAHFAAAKDFSAVLATTARYLTRYPGNNPLQIARADALVKTARYREAVDFLRTVRILPSENASAAWQVWNAAEKALGMAPTYPENLGYGEPFADSAQDQDAQGLGAPEPDVHAPHPAGGAVQTTRELFNGRNLAGWYTYLQGKGKNVDPDGVFTVTNGVIHVNGRGFGALVSEEEFSDYHLRVEYRFLGGEQFGWKKGWAPDSGILFHSTGPDGGFGGIWMESLEMNLIKGATGDFWGVGAHGKDTVSLSCRVGKRRHENRFAVYEPTGSEIFTITGNTRVCRFDIDPNWRDRFETGIAANENPIGEWNVAELVCRGDEVTAIFNGKVVNRGFGARPTKGRIQLQAEGCAIEFRRVTISPAKPEHGRALGYMLDVSRDKVPTMNSLKRIVDVIAELGYGQFQLYTEHTFAYKGHETVWKDASPITPEEVRELDDYCWKRGVELVPNQNSFGHMERWLRHPAYRHLAEAPDCPVLPGGNKAKWPRAICPTDPASTNFLDGLYGQLLPCFRHTRLFNAGCDEVFDLVPGVRSAADLAKRGESAVFLDHFRAIQRLAGARGKQVMYWADHLLWSPEAYGRIPNDAIALVYAYEADNTMDYMAERAVREGLPFYVAPGSSSWCSLFGRYWNMRHNVAQAFDTARRYGAEGCLLCDWGDLGHIQPFLVSLPALVYAAECARGTPPTDAQVVSTIDRITGAKCGETLLALGNLYLLAYDSQLNTTALFRLLQEGPKYPRPWHWTNARLEATFAEGRKALAKLDATSAPDWVKDECELLKLILEATELSWQRDYTRLSTEIANRYRKIWLRLNRPGGLEDSVKTLFPHGCEQIP